VIGENSLTRTYTVCTSHLILLGDKIKESENVTSMRKVINIYRILAGKSEGKRPLEKKTMHRWEDKIHCV
jgi:hypothetical protein